MPTKYFRGDIETSGDYLKLNSTDVASTRINRGSNIAAIDLQLPSFNAGLIGNLNGGNTTKVVQFDSVGAAASSILTLAAPITTNRTWTFPDAASTFVGTAIAQTLTNKTIDATQNTVSNLGTSNFAGGVISTDISIGADNTKIPTALAAKSYTDTAIAGLSSTYVPAARNLIAGAGLSGGGDLSADRTFSVNVDGVTLEIPVDTLQVKDGGISDAKLGTGINANKIADGSVSNAAFQNIAGLTSNAQTQLNAKQNLSEKGVANGYASLDSGGKVPVSQLPNSLMEFLGNWNASTNTPTLADGVGNTGDTYRVNVAGTQNLGSGAQTFVVGDWVMYDASGVWRLSHAGADSVLSVDGRSGVVTLGDLYQPLDADLTALAGLSTTGLIARTGSGTATVRTLTAGSTKISITNGDGVSGNPTIDVVEANLSHANIGGITAIANGGTGQSTATAAFGALSPLTTKGDILVHNGTINTRLPVGTNGQVLTADSAQSTGLSWTSPLTNPMTTLGDTIYGGASGAATRLAGNTTTTRQFLRQTGTGTVSAAPAWDTLVATDYPLATNAARGAVSYEDSGTFTVYLKSGSNAGNASNTGVSATARYSRVGKNVCVSVPSTLQVIITDAVFFVSDSPTTGTQTWPTALRPSATTNFVITSQLGGSIVAAVANLTSAGQLQIFSDAAGSSFGATNVTKGPVTLTLNYTVQ